MNALVNLAYAGQVVTAQSGRQYTIGLDGSVDVADQDQNSFFSLGFQLTGAVPKQSSVFTVEVPLDTTGAKTYAHGLGGTPTIVDTSVICTDADGEGGYAQNEQCPYPMTAPGVNGPPLSFDDTNCYTKVQGAGLTLTTKDGTTSFSLTTSKWSLRITAIRISTT